MKRLLPFIAAALLLSATICLSTAENAKRDNNGVPAIIGVNSSNETTRIHTTDSGDLLVAATGTWTVTASGTTTVTATDLDIRDLTAASDTVTVTGSVTATVSATNLDIRDLTSVSDSVTVVTPADVDIRNLTAASDTVTVTGSVDVGTVTTLPAITGTVTANAGTNLNTSALALESTLSAINTKLVTGTDIGDVTINNAAGAAAVNIQDGGNAITVDGAVTTSGTVTATGTVSISDGITIPDVLTGTMNSLNVSLTDGGDRADVKNNGALQVAEEHLVVWEYDNNSSVSAAATATFTSAASNTHAMICAECGGTTYFKVGGATADAAADNDGQMLLSNSCYIAEQGEMRTINIYNDHTATCKYAVQWRR